MQRGTSGWRRKVAAATTVVAMAAAVAACGGDDGADDSAASGGGETAPGAVPKLSTKPVELSFLWFEWPPAQALEDFANAEYTKERPNVKVKVNTVPNPNWHDAIFTQFAAKQDGLRHPDPRLAAHRRGGRRTATSSTSRTS